MKKNLIRKARKKTKQVIELKKKVQNRPKQVIESKKIQNRPKQQESKKKVQNRPKQDIKAIYKFITNPDVGACKKYHTLKGENDKEPDIHICLDNVNHVVIIYIGSI